MADYKVRYIGIDTAEIHFGVQCYGPEAKQRNEDVAEGKKVALQRDLSDIDRYDRLLRYV